MEMSIVNPADFSSVEIFIDKCDQFDHTDRVKYLVNIGRHSLQHNESKNLLQVLSKGGLYERQLALFSTFGSKNTSLIIMALLDLSQLLRKRAVKLAARIASDEEILSVVDSMSPEVLKSIMKLLFKNQRVNLVNHILMAIKPKYPKIFDSHFLFGSQEFVQKGLRDIESLTDDQMIRLSRLHPKAAYERIMTFKSETLNDPTFLRLVDNALPILAQAKLSKDLVMKMIKSILKVTTLSRAFTGIQSFFRKMPEEICQIILENDETIYFHGIRFEKVINRVSNSTLLAFHRRYSSQRILIDDFKSLLPERRVEIYHETWKSRCNNDDLVPPWDFIDCLPTEERVKEARKFLNSPTIKNQPSWIMSYASLLPWEEAFQVLSEYIRSSDIDTRKEALTAQITTVIYERDNLPNALQLVQRHRNDPDPVRYSMLNALAKIPKWSCQLDDLPKFEEIFKDAFSARDLSHSTEPEVLGVILSLFSVFPEWSIGQLVNYAKASDFYLVRPDSFPSRGKLTKKPEILKLLDRKLEPVIQDNLNRKKYSVLISLAQFCEENFEITEGIKLALKKVAMDSDTWIAPRALNYLHDEPKLQREVIMHLLNRDKTWIYQDTVRNYLLRHKQSLLQPFLGVFEEQGMWNKDGQIRVVLLESRYFYLWTPKQQDIYLETLNSLIQDDGNTQYSLISYVDLIGRLNFTDKSRELLSSLISDERTVLRDVAITTLTYLEEGKGIPLLIGTLGDERARVSIYAFNRVLRKFSPSAAFKILSEVPTKQVTVAKQIYRLIAELQTDDAFHFLLEKEKGDMHIDVRIALLKGLWNWVDKADIFPIFQHALQDERKEIPISLINLPQDILPSKNKYLLQLICYALDKAPHDVGYAALERCGQWFSDYDRKLPPLLEKWIITSKLESEIRLAANSLFQWYMEEESERICNIFRQYLSDKFKLQMLLNVFFSYSNSSYGHDITRLIVSILKTDPLCFEWYLKLVFEAWQPEELLEEIMDLIPTLHADGLVRVQSFMSNLHFRYQDFKFISSLERKLRHHRDERGRRLGLVALLQIANGPKGWTKNLKAKLEIYQNDESLMIRQAAAWIFPKILKKDDKGDEDAEDSPATPADLSDEDTIMQGN